MDRAKKTTARKPPVRREALAPGLHVAVVEMASGSAFLVRTRKGTRVHAKLDDGVSRALVEGCLKTKRRVLVVEDGDGPVIVGAITTTEEPSDAPHVVSAKEIELRAAKSLTLRVGRTTLRLQKAGLLLQGSEMVVDIAALVRFLSARVELP